MKSGGFPSRIVLCGFAGSGKSTLAPKLAKILDYDCIDTDNEISHLTGYSIPAYFLACGESRFRRIEARVLRGALRKNSVVIAVGGGALLDSKNSDMVTRASTLIYLSCSVCQLVKRLKDQSDRPLLTQRSESRKERISQLLKKRLSGYERAHIRVSTSHRSVSQTARRIIELLREQYPS